MPIVRLAAAVLATGITFTLTVSAAEARPTATTARYVKASQQFCILEPEPRTGTRIRLEECRTAKGWEAEGLTVTRRVKRAG